jgi:UDP-glucuronate decarboxylase
MRHYWRAMRGVSVSTENPITGSEFRIIVVGASGWLGMATLDYLEKLLGPSFQSRVKCFGSTTKLLELINGTVIDQKSLVELGELPETPSLLLHYAFLTRDKVAGYTLSEYINKNRALSAYVEKSANSIGVEATLVTSSGAVYNADKTLATDIETNPYGVLKLEDEKLFTSWAEKHHKKAVIPRIFNLSGHYINKTGAYVLASLIKDALSGGPLTLKASHEVVRSYCAIDEVISVCLGSLLDQQEASHIFDTAGSESIEVGELAQSIKQALDAPGAIQRPALTNDTKDIYVGKRDPYSLLLAKNGITEKSISEQIRWTADYISKTPNI